LFIAWDLPVNLLTVPNQAVPSPQATLAPSLPPPNAINEPKGIDVSLPPNSLPDKNIIPVATQVAIDIPVVYVAWSYNGLSAEDMERRVVLVSERAYSTTVNGIDHSPIQMARLLAWPR
jgi:hypothetical protein